MPCENVNKNEGHCGNFIQKANILKGQDLSGPNIVTAYAEKVTVICISRPCFQG